MEKLRSSKLICVFEVTYKKECLIPLLRLYHGCLSKSSLSSLWWPAGKLAVWISQMLLYRPSLKNQSAFTYLVDSGWLAQPRPAFIWYILNMESVRLLDFGIWRHYLTLDWSNASMTSAFFIRQTCWLCCMLMMLVLQLLILVWMPSHTCQTWRMLRFTLKGTWSLD